MNDLIIGKVSTALKGHWANPDLVSRPPCPLTAPFSLFLHSRGPPAGVSL